MELPRSVLKKLLRLQRPVRVGITGGRTFCDTAVVSDALESLRAAVPIEVVVQGCANGADTEARHWALRQRVPVEDHPARWRRADGSQDPGAGFTRNLEIIPRIDVLVSFPGGNGTAHMTSHSIRAGVPVILIEPVTRRG